MTEEQKEKPGDLSSPDSEVEKTSIADISRTLLEESLTRQPRSSLSGEEDLNARPIIFDNHWLITERLGEGGMSVVYRAKHLELNRNVAIKVLLPHLTDNTKNLQRFRQEAVTASSLNHPNVIKVENFGVTPDGRTFIIMDFIEGILNWLPKFRPPAKVEFATPKIVESEIQRSSGNEKIQKEVLGRI